MNGKNIYTNSYACLEAEAGKLGGTDAADLDVESLEAGNVVGGGTTNTLVEANKAVGHGP